MTPVATVEHAWMVHAGPDFEGFEHQGAPAADLDDVLDLGRAPPRWLALVGAHWPRLRYRKPLLVLATLAVIGVVAWTTVERGERPVAAPSTMLTRLPRHWPTPSPVTTVRALAHRVGSPLGYVPQSTPVGACTLITPGHSPLPRIGRTVRRITPGYRIVDAAMVLDQSTGLCAIQLRAANRVGDVLVVSTAAPPAYSPLSSFDRIETGIARGAQETTKYAWEISSTGFQILVGATGPGRGLPSGRELVRLASRPALIW